MLGSVRVWLIDLRNQMSTMLSRRLAADDDAQREQAAQLRQAELEEQMTRDKAAAAAAAALKAKKDRVAARRARGSIVLETHDLMGGGRRVEASVAQRLQALGLALADEAGFTHGDVEAGSLARFLMQRCALALLPAALKLFTIF